MSIVAIEGEAAPISLPEGTSTPSGLGCLVIVARRHGLHLTVPQLIHDNVLPSREVSVAEILRCAQSSGLKGKVVQLDWGGPCPSQQGVACDRKAQERRQHGAVAT